MLDEYGPYPCLGYYSIQVNMKMPICRFSNHLQRILYEYTYGEWYLENEVYFKKSLSLQHGDLNVNEYIFRFSKLHCLCVLKESESHDFNHFIGGLRPDILENIDSCKDIFEAHREAIHVEYRLEGLNSLCMSKSKSQKGKSPQITKEYIVEPVTEII